MRASALASLAFAALACGLLAGCVEDVPSRYPDECQGDGPALWGALEIRTSGNPGVATDPRQALQTVAVLRGDVDFGLVVESGDATVQVIKRTTDGEETSAEAGAAGHGHGSEDATATAAQPNATKQSLAVLTLPPGAQRVEVSPFAHGVDCIRLRSLVFDTVAPREGALAEVGKGVLVRTAGFLEDGSLFYTNMHEVADGADWDGMAWPKASMYEPSSTEPLQVYVYDQDASEMPAYWGGVASGLPVGAPAPLDAALPGQYGPTIRGFNEALKGLSTSTTKVVWIAPEDAYTRPGREDHPLYGEPLVFLIQAVAVADLPCAPSDLVPGLVQDTACFRR